jgi:transposase
VDANDIELQFPARHGQNERELATARNSWLFSDTVAGAKASAIVYSLALTCRACNVEPYAYLHHVLTELPQRAPDADISDLLPFNFNQQKPLRDAKPQDSTNTT